MKELMVRVNALEHVAAVPNTPQPRVQSPTHKVTGANSESATSTASLPAQAVVLDNQVQLVQQRLQVAQPVDQPPGPSGGPGTPWVNLFRSNTPPNQQKHVLNRQWQP